MQRDVEAYREWKESFAENNEKLNREIVSLYRRTPDQQLTEAAIREHLNRVPPQVLRKEADKFIAKQGLENAGSPAGISLKEELKKNTNFQGMTVSTFDLDYMIAETLQKLYSSEDPRAEYYDWVETQQKIALDINTGGTTQEEVDARNLFIDFLDDRETEIKRIMSLYAGAAIHGQGYYKDMAQEKLAFLTFKLSELRRLRTRTEQLKNKSDEQERREQELEKDARVLAAGTAMVATASAAETYMLAKTGMFAKDYEKNLGEYMVEFRPVSRNREEAEQKISSVRENSRKMAQMINGFRFGKSKEEQEKEGKTQLLKDRIRRIKGFEMSRFNTLERDSLSA